MKEEYRYPLFSASYADRSLGACASTPTRASTGEYVDDSVITTKVKSLLAEDDFSNHSRSVSKLTRAPFS